MYAKALCECDGTLAGGHPNRFFLFLISGDQTLGFVINSQRYAVQPLAKMFLG